MKFGLQFHEHMLARWAHHYVDYNGLRAQIRARAEVDNGDMTDIVEQLKASIKAFETLVQNGYSSIRKLEEQLRTRFSMPANPSGWDTNACLPIPEFNFFQQYYEDIMLELEQLQWFNTVNETAAVRLFDKIIASEPGQAPRWQNAKDEWLAQQHSANKASHDERLGIFQFTCALRQKRSQPKYADGTSLALSALFNYQLPDCCDLEQLSKRVADDDPSMVEKIVQNCHESGFHLDTTFGHLVGDLLILAIMHRAEKTSKLLLSTIIKDDLAITIDQGSMLVALRRQMEDKDDFDENLVKALCSTATLSTFFPGHAKLKKTLLHYAAQYGYAELCKAFLVQASERKSPFLEALLMKDDDSKTPLHYAVLSGSIPTLSAMLGALQKNKTENSTTAHAALLGELLLLAIGTHNSAVTEIISNEDPDFGYTSFGGETALYRASQAGDVRLVQPIICSMLRAGKSLDGQRPDSGWTSLMVACANGHQEVVSHLVDAGADPNIQDARGWTAQEHAVFRGHMAIAELLTLAASLGYTDGPAKKKRSIKYRDIKMLTAGQRAVVVNLGSVQGGHRRPALRLPESDTTNTHAAKEPFTLMLEISMPGKDSHWVPVPLLHDYTNEPFVFVLDDDAPPQITVRLFSCSSPQSKLLLSGGTVILGQDSDKYGDMRESMLRETTVFMMTKDAMEPAGSVLLSYVVVKAFPGLESSRSSNCRRLPGESARLVGHRGLGQNTASQSSLQLGENTAMSFLSAAKLGASYIEANLQLTRDLEAVIFHDFSLSELGTDVPIHDVTLAQYKHVSSLQENMASAPTKGGRTTAGPKQRQRTFSTGEESMLRSLQLRERLLHTVDFKNKGFKPNTRGHSIQDTLATLDELLVKLPEDVGFNIEMKYPRLHEAVEAGVAPVTIDMNTFVDSALEKIQRLAGCRPIILSSFTPEICILLSLKQRAYPVMFITNAGKVPMADRELRAASLQMGIQFARRWNLDGIVLACEAFLYCPRFIRFVQNAGLVCASYGLPNNDAANARIQVDAGIDIIITDKVKLIAEELKDTGK